MYDVSNIYHVPLVLESQGIHKIIQEKLKFENMASSPDLRQWRQMAETVDNLTDSTQIAIVGKYTGSQDTYLSVIKAIKHSSIHLKKEIEIVWIEASELEDETKLSDPTKHASAWKQLKSVHGILVPGGFGTRGVKGKILAAKYARENKIPYLGICLGMQIMVIEFARNVLGLPEAHSAEFDESTPEPFVIFMPEINQKEMGGTMRLGSRNTQISHQLKESNDKSLACKIYGFGSYEGDAYTTWEVSERHRHRYEVNPEKIEQIEQAGLIFSGKDDKRMEIAELPQSVHPFYFGTQFHPEFKSRPNRPSPPFYAFCSVCVGNLDGLSKAGTMWRDYEEDIDRQISELYSSNSSPFRRKRAPSQSNSLANSPIGKSPNKKQKKVL